MRSLNTRNFTAYYVMALIIIATLSITSHLVLMHSLRANDGAALVINVSGRQRMLSQRIAGMAAQYRLGDPSARQELLDAVTALEKAHEVLIAEDATVSGEEKAELHALYFAGVTPLDAEVRNFAATARRIAALPADDPRVPSLDAELFSRARSPLLKQLDEAVSVHQLAAERKLSVLQRLQWAILAIVLCTLFIEAFMIFQPMIRRISAYTKELLQLATTDPLTGAVNRRAFLESGAIELARSQRYKRPLSLIMLDADHFKKVNDRYGHAGGDRVLQALSKELKRGLRSSDVLGRVGGEEFAILLPETQQADAAKLADRLRQRVAALKVQNDQNHICFTVSMGVAEVRPEAGIEHALKVADEALYRAKAHGRNRVMSAANESQAGADSLASAQATSSI